MSTTHAAAELRQRGYTLLPGLYGEQDLADFRAALDRLRAQFAAPALTARDPIWLAENVEIAGPGLAFYQFLGFVPELAPRLFRPEAMAVLRTLLGDDMHLELVGGVMSDETRPFTEWESHLGGIDDERWRKASKRPRNAEIMRIVHFLLLDDLSEESGPWRVIPREVGGPVDPPASIDELDWPGSDTITCAAGTVLLLEESVWHAVVPRKTPGMRRFIGSYFVSREAEPTVGHDASLDAVGPGDPLLDSILRHRPQRPSSRR